MTSNIPEWIPIECGDDFKTQILEWMRTRPVSDYDNCVNRRVRWRYEIQDLHLSTYVKVTDLADGTTFIPKDNPDNW